MTTIQINEINRAIRLCIDHIAAHQSVDGYFTPLISTRKTMESSQSGDKSLFHTSLIALALKGIPERLVSIICSKASHFLLQHKSPTWTWNYSLHSGTKTYPDDIDDTSCALSVLTLYTPDTLSGEAIAHITKHLCKQEVFPGGPYRTWYTDNPSWSDVDSGANANLAYFLSLHGVRLEGMQRYIETCIDEENYTSLYYWNPLSVMYFIARSYKGDYSQTLYEHIIRLLKKDTHDVLHESMSMTSLLRDPESSKTFSTIIEYSLQRIINHIVRGIQPHGLYIEKIDKDATWYSGGSALTAAFCLEALWLYKQKIETNNKVQEKQNVYDYEDKIFSSIMSRVHEIMETPTRHEEIKTVIQNILQSENPRDIALLPFRIIHSSQISSHSSEKKSLEAIAIELGVAHLLGNISYGIYDSIADGDNKVSLREIPLAHKALSACQNIFYEQIPHHSSKKYTYIKKTIDEIFNVMHNAQTDEANQNICSITEDIISIHHCPSIPETSRHHSLGYALAPLLALCATGHDDVKNIELIKKFFEHYTQARHLHDDIHDWKQDLSSGYINRAVLICLYLYSQISEASFPLSRTYQTFENEIADIMYKEAIPLLIQEINECIEIAVSILEKLKKENIHTQPLADLLTPLQEGLAKAEAEYKQLQEFVSAYYFNSPSPQYAQNVFEKQA